MMNNSENQLGIRRRALRVGPRGVVFVLDDELEVRDVLRKSLHSAGLECVCFADSSGLLATARNRIPVCILVDINLRERSGIDLLRDLPASEYPAPTLVISRRVDVATVVAAIKLGAEDFVPKPFDPSELVARIFDVAERQEARGTPSLPAAIQSIRFPGRERLSSREAEILWNLVSGSSAKTIGSELCISARTVEDHRRNIYRKLGAKNMTELMLIMLIASRS
jgi:FixJ family two-component response regulator